LTGRRWVSLGQEGETTQCDGSGQMNVVGRRSEEGRETNLGLGLVFYSRDLCPALLYPRTNTTWGGKRMDPAEVVPSKFCPGVGTGLRKVLAREGGVSMGSEDAPGCSSRR